MFSSYNGERSRTGTAAHQTAPFHLFLSILTPTSEPFVWTSVAFLHALVLSRIIPNCRQQFCVATVFSYSFASENTEYGKGCVNQIMGPW